MKSLYLLQVFCLNFFIMSVAYAQSPLTPLEESKATKPCTHSQLAAFAEGLEKYSDLVSVKVAGYSVKNKPLYAIEFSKGKFGRDKSKIRVLILAQQHGNEQSGKEGALMLASVLTRPEMAYIFDKIDLVIMPQVNPDGSEVNERYNANKVDLNRNHLVLDQPEVLAVHKLFDRYKFEVTLDVHEYNPYNENWIALGYRRNSLETIGPVNNPNISEGLRAFAYSSFVPYLLSCYSGYGITASLYCPGGPPGTSYIRHSTFDINDGRQSFGIQNTLSFIQEGMNGNDSFAENIINRSRAQMYGMKALLEFVHSNRETIKTLVDAGRKELTAVPGKEMISVRSEHVANGDQLDLPVWSYKTEKDSVIRVPDYRPLVKSTLTVKKPAGYLIPRSNIKLTDWAKRHSFETEPFKMKDGDLVEEYFINSVDSIDFELDQVIDASVTVSELQNKIVDDDYIFLPCAQIKGTMIAIALEPQSILGLATYKTFDDLLTAGEKYPVLRVIRSQP